MTLALLYCKSAIGCETRLGSAEAQVYFSRHAFLWRSDHFLSARRRTSRAAPRDAARKEIEDLGPAQTRMQLRMAWYRPVSRWRHRREESNVPSRPARNQGRVAASILGNPVSSRGLNRQRAFARKRVYEPLPEKRNGDGPCRARREPRTEGGVTAVGPGEYCRSQPRAAAMS